MSFRFQKRVKIAPGLRLNISKGGVSTSIDKRGVSLTIGKRGLYGNVGIPGSGLSYRKKLNKKTNTWYQKQTNNIPHTVSLVFDQASSSLLFVDENGEKVPSAVEREIKKELRDDIQTLYNQKEKEINDQTTKLLCLHKQTIPPRTVTELEQLAEATLKMDLRKPDQKEIFDELKFEYEADLSFVSRCLLLLPSKRKEFLQKIMQEAVEQYNNEMEIFLEAKKDYEEERLYRLKQVKKVVQGQVKEMGIWLEKFLLELDFPLETNVSFEVLSSSTIYVDVDLPEIEDLPLTKASILKSGKLKVQEKSSRELRDHYATMVGGTALYLCSFIFSLLPTCEEIIISGYTQVRNKETGHVDDQYIYSLKVRKNIFYSLNIAEAHPIHAFANFDPIINVTKTYIFKEIEPYKILKKD